MSKISCDIIKDLLPLYIDGVCSSDSIDVIEEHLKDCPICEAEFLNLQNNTDIKPEIDKDIDKAVKNANKKIKKGKKKVVIKTVSIIASILLVLGSICYLIVPIRLAQDVFYNDFLAAKSASFEIEINNKIKPNYTGRYASLFIDESHGKYTLEKTEASEILTFSENKQIAISRIPLQKENVITSFDEYNGVFGFNGTHSLPFFMPLVKKGIENMGINPDTIYHDFDFYIRLITTQEPFASHSALKAPKEFSMWYAYYAAFATIMPGGNISYLTIKNNDIKSFGWSFFSEEYGLRYTLNIQSTDNILENTAIIMRGFTKEEMIEIIESLKLK